MTRKEFKEIADKLPRNCDMCIGNCSATRCEHCDYENNKFIWKTSALELIRVAFDLGKYYGYSDSSCSCGLADQVDD